MPKSSPQYDLVVIGGGTAGLTASEIATQLGIRVALVEKYRIGGECTWTGCIPSKALLTVARQVHNARHADHFGISVNDVQVDFGRVMDFVHSTIQQIYEDESPEVLQRDKIDVYAAEAKFSDPHTLTLSDGNVLKAKYILLCTGASPIVPEGFHQVPYLTNENLFDLKELPAHLIIIGGGPVGTEMAQAFCRLGSEVTLVSDESRLLPRDEEEASALIQSVLQDEGVCLQLGVPAVSARGEVGKITVTLATGDEVNGSHVLLAVGKKVNVSGLNPEKAGIDTYDNQLVLKDTLQTSQKHIYAAGDVTGSAQFTHYAAMQAVTALRNMFLPFSWKGIQEHVPWTTFTDPEVAHAGLTEDQAFAQHGDRVDVTRLPMTRSDRAMTEGKPVGFMKLIHLPNGKLLGATIVGYNAGEMINEWVQIIEKGGKVFDMAMAPHVYPTLGITNSILATEQMKKQFKSGLLIGFVRWLVRLKL